MPCGNTDKLLFTTATTLTIGSGAKAKFWESAWLQGVRLKDLAPLVFSTSRKKNRTLQQAIQSDQWLLNLNLPAEIAWTTKLID